MTVRQRLARVLAAAAAVAACALAMGQATPAGPIQLRGNHPAGAAALTGAVRAERTMPLELTVVLGLRHRAALEQLLADQQNPASPRYHQWLTPQAFASRFGPTEKQIGAVADWLKGEGFEVTSLDRLGRTIQATGDAETAERAFSTTVVSAGGSFANTTDPTIPAEFDGVVVSIIGLDNMHAAVPAGLHRSPPPRSSAQRRPQLLALADAGGSSPEDRLQMPGATEEGSTAFGPVDVETFYDEAPLLGAGNSGTASPDCVALDEDSDYLPSAVTLYDSTFGLAPAAITRVYPDGSSPGTNGDEVETLLDIDYAHASAPGTPIRAYVGSEVYDSIQKSVTDNACGAITISFIYCGESSSFYTGLDSLFTQAASQGQSIFIASGDWGAAGLRYSPAAKTCVTGTSQNPSEMAASPHVTAVGGTTFSPQYDSSGNDISVVGVTPGGTESGWNASGGGKSAIFPKPLWQTGAGVPADDARDIPDVSMIAWAPYVFIGADVDGAAQIQCCWGGTSLAAPLWAGYSRVLAVASGNVRLGLLNPAIYSLANAGLAADGFDNVVSGNNTYNGVTGYTAGPGYDQVTGWGSVDMTEFASAFTSALHPTPTATPTQSPTPVMTPVPSALNCAPAKVNFGKVAAGATSNVQTVTLSNPNKKKAVPITLEGWNSTGDFAVSHGVTTCASVTTLSPGQKCTIGLVFKPALPAAQSGTLTIEDNATNNPQVIQLKGTGK